MQASLESNQTPESPVHCLNCDAFLHGNYCSSCGQERGKPIVSLHESISEVLNDFFKFDTKLFCTFWFLLTRPGFLTNEYAAGKRVSYLQPIKLYLTINFFLFLLAGWLDPIQISREDFNNLFPDNTASLEAFNATLSAVIPPLLLIVFPLFATLLKLVYIRSKIYFALHFIFSLHFFSFFMIAALPGMFYEPLNNWFGVPAIFIYLFFALKTVYRQSWLKTLIKWFILSFGTLIILLIWYLIAAIYTFIYVALTA